MPEGINGDCLNLKILLPIVKKNATQKKFLMLLSILDRPRTDMVKVVGKCVTIK